MTYSTPYDPTYPDPATDLVSAAPTHMKTIEAMFVERMSTLMGVVFTDDPMVITKLGIGVSVLGKQTYEPTYDAGNSGSAKTLDWAANGTTQKLTLTASCTITAAVPPAGVTFKVNVVQNASGGWSLTWPANYNFQSNITPVVITTALSGTLWQGYSTGSVVYLSVAGTGFDVS